MKFKCKIVDRLDLWFTEGKIYEGEIPISPIEFSGGTWVYIYKADDGNSAYARRSKFEIVRNTDFKDLNV